MSVSVQLAREIVDAVEVGSFDDHDIQNLRDFLSDVDALVESAQYVLDNGSTPADPKKCRTCDGDGEIAPDSDYWGPSKCHDCNGKGFVTPRVGYQALRDAIVSLTVDS